MWLPEDRDVCDIETVMTRESILSGDRKGRILSRKTHSTLGAVAASVGCLHRRSSMHPKRSGDYEIDAISTSCKVDGLL